MPGGQFARSTPRPLSLSAIVGWTSGGVAQLVERLHGMQEVREFDSPRLHQKLQDRGGAADLAGSPTEVWGTSALRGSSPLRSAIGGRIWRRDHVERWAGETERIK